MLFVVELSQREQSIDNHVQCTNTSHFSPFCKIFFGFVHAIKTDSSAHRPKFSLKNEQTNVQ